MRAVLCDHAFSILASGRQQFQEADSLSPISKHQFRLHSD